MSISDQNARKTEDIPNLVTDCDLLGRSNKNGRIDYLKKRLNFYWGSGGFFLKDTIVYVMLSLKQHNAKKQTIAWEWFLGFVRENFGLMCLKACFCSVLGTSGVLENGWNIKMSGVDNRSEFTLVFCGGFCFLVDSIPYKPNLYNSPFPQYLCLLS